MKSKNMLIVGMALIGALALLTGTFVTIPTVLAYTGTISDPDLRSIGDPGVRIVEDPNERIFLR